MWGWGAKACHVGLVGLRLVAKACHGGLGGAKACHVLCDTKVHVLVIMRSFKLQSNDHQL